MRDIHRHTLRSYRGGSIGSKAHRTLASVNRCCLLCGTYVAIRLDSTEQVTSAQKPTGPWQASTDVACSVEHTWPFVKKQQSRQNRLESPPDLGKRQPMLPALRNIRGHSFRRDRAGNIGSKAHRTVASVNRCCLLCGTYMAIHLETTEQATSAQKPTGSWPASSQCCLLCRTYMAIRLETTE